MMLTRSSLSLLPGLRRTAQRAAFSTIPVEHVARVMRMHVGDEETAVKADAVFQRALGEIKAEYGGNGGVSATRTVCKSEWEYEVEMVFEGRSRGFKKVECYAASSRAAHLVEAMAELKKRGHTVIAHIIGARTPTAPAASNTQRCSRAASPSTASKTKSSSTA